MASSLPLPERKENDSFMNDLVLGFSEMYVDGNKVPSSVFIKIDNLEKSLKKMHLGKQSLDAVAYSSWLINRHNPIGPMNRFFRSKDSASRLHYSVQKSDPEHPLKTMVESEYIPEEGSADLIHLTQYLLTNPTKCSSDYRKTIAWIWVDSDPEIVVKKRDRKDKSGFSMKSSRTNAALKGKTKKPKKDGREELLIGIQAAIPVIAHEMRRKEAPKEDVEALKSIEGLCKQGLEVKKSNIDGFQERLQYRFLQECKERLAEISDYDSVSVLIDCM